MDRVEREPRRFLRRGDRARSLAPDHHWFRHHAAAHHHSVRHHAAGAGRVPGNCGTAAGEPHDEGDQAGNEDQPAALQLIPSL